MNRTFVVALLVVTAVMVTTAAFAAPLDKVRFIRISAQDSKAVIVTEDGKMRVVTLGDTIAENTTIMEIIPGRIILEEKTERGMETIIVRMDNGKTRIERLRRQPDESQPLVAPATSQK